jgi:hypothetical protein
MISRLLLRASAVAIAVAGIVDPVLTLNRHARPEVALIASDHLPDAALTDRVLDALSSRFTVVRGPSVGAAATVVVGDELPASVATSMVPGFVVLPEPRRPYLTVTAVRAPSRAHVQSRVPVEVQVRAQAARGRKLSIALRSGDALIDRTTRDVPAGDETVTVSLTLVAPAERGTVPVTVQAELEDSPETRTRADVGIEIRDRRLAILTFDRRPSWLSTFVRRAIEADPRFVVTSRIATSLGAAAAAGVPPDSLASLPSLALFDAVVVGAPGELTAADAAGLEEYLRRRGGAVILLPDEPVAPAPFIQLTGTTGWRPVERVKPAGDPPATTFFSPETPPGQPTDRPDALWRTAVGSGRLAVFTAIDAWQFRDSADGAFDRFWRGTIAAAADATPAPIDVVPDRFVLAPGESTRARIARGPEHPLEWIELRPNSLSGPVSFDVSRDGARVVRTLLVVPDARPPASDDRRLIGAWTAATGGGVIAESRLETLGSLLQRALAPPAERVRWRPMRSAWWILPFALVLGAEWWMRRRSGLR